MTTRLGTGAPDGKPALVMGGSGLVCPREIVFTDELPRLPSGKLLRRRVRDWLANGPAATA